MRYLYNCPIASELLMQLCTLQQEQIAAGVHF